MNKEPNYKERSFIIYMIAAIIIMALTLYDNIYYSKLQQERMDRNAAREKAAEERAIQRHEWEKERRANEAEKSIHGIEN